MSADLPRRRPDRRDYDASAVGYLIVASVSALVVAAFVATCAPRTPVDERGCYTVMWPAPPKIVCPK